MFAFSRKLHRRTAQSLIALLGSLWLLAAAAPCVMAAPRCPGMGGDCDSMDSRQPAASVPCEALQAVDCQVAQADTLVANTPVVDFSLLPVLLFTLPHDAVSNAERAHRIEPDRYAFDLYPPPLRLQHSVFLT
jgi:hypothetical protein